MKDAVTRTRQAEMQYINNAMTDDRLGFSRFYRWSYGKQSSLELLLSADR